MMEGVSDASPQSRLHPHLPTNHKTALNAREIYTFVSGHFNVLENCSLLQENKTSSEKSVFLSICGQKVTPLEIVAFGA